MYVKPDELLRQAIELGERKARLPVQDIGIRAFLSAALLGFATALAVYAAELTGMPLVGALVFPVGFVMLSLLGLELVTGNFALLLLPLWRRRIRLSELVRNWTLAYLAHIAGGLLLAYLIAVAWTAAGTTVEPWVRRLIRIAEHKTLFYAELGAKGIWLAFVKAVLCNWMVTLAAFLGLSAQDVVGKTLAMWMPIFTFFALGFEHSVVNLFLIPSAMLMGADITIGQWWLWNQVPVTLGNIIGGALFTAGMLYWTYGRA
jgi:formate/nitrite transporter